MLISEEFSALNINNWRISNAVANPLYYQSTWNSNNIAFSGGKLRLTLNNTPRHNLPYSSGQLVSATADHRHGEYSAWIKAISGSGTGTSFGLCSSSNARPNDRIAIDILGKANNLIRCWIAQGDWLYQQVLVVPVNTVSGFHKYTIHWGTTGVSWNVDNQVIHTLTTAAIPPGKRLPPDGMKIFLNNWAAPATATWAGSFHYTIPKIAEVDRFEKRPAVSPARYLIVLDLIG